MAQIAPNTPVKIRGLTGTVVSHAWETSMNLDQYILYVVELDRPIWRRGVEIARIAVPLRDLEVLPTQ
jgi:hypothetical protein